MAELIHNVINLSTTSYHFDTTFLHLCSLLYPHSPQKAIGTYVFLALVCVKPPEIGGFAHKKNPQHKCYGLSIYASISRSRRRLIARLSSAGLPSARLLFSFFRSRSRRRLMAARSFVSSDVIFL